MKHRSVLFAALGIGLLLSAAATPALAWGGGRGGGGGWHGGGWHGGGWHGGWARGPGWGWRGGPVWWGPRIVVGVPYYNPYYYPYYYPY